MLKDTKTNATEEKLRIENIKRDLLIKKEELLYKKKIYIARLRQLVNIDIKKVEIKSRKISIPENVDTLLKEIKISPYYKSVKEDIKKLNGECLLNCVNFTIA